jgi:hypothetical protein
MRNEFCSRVSGVMTTFASCAPATTNIWADNNYICFADTITSLFAGFAVFSVLGNMAHHERSIAADSAPLRAALCEMNVEKGLELSCPASCGVCEEDTWMLLQHAECCGNFQVGTADAQRFVLAFSVLSLALPLTSL